MMESRGNPKWLLGAVLGVGWLAILLGPVVGPNLRRATFPDDWITAKLEWSTDIGRDGFPLLTYTRSVTRESHGVRDSWLEVQRGQSMVRVCPHSSEHGYIPGDSKPILFEVTSFLRDRECPRPAEPFRVCLQWWLEDGGAFDVTPVTCSPLYTQPIRND